MTKKLRPTIIGMFVFGAISIVLLCLIYLYSRAVLEDSRTFVLYFKGNLGGLSVGSPVTFEGFRIGQVSSIGIYLHGDEIKIPVYIQLIRGKRHEIESQYVISTLIQKGLVADIALMNLFTNQAGIQLFIDPKHKETPVTSNTRGYIIIPTVVKPSNDITLQEVLRTANKTFKTIDEFVQSAEVTRAFTDTSKTMKSANVLMNNSNQKIDPLSKTLQSTLREIQDSAYELKELSGYLSRHPEAIIKGKGN